MTEMIVALTQVALVLIPIAAWLLKIERRLSRIETIVQLLLERNTWSEDKL